MSKSLGNVINPDDMVKEYGADALRTYEMFIGDYEKEAVWSEQGLNGCKRFLDRVWKIGSNIVRGDFYTPSLEGAMHRAIKKVTDDIDSLKFNTAVSTLMSLLNLMEKEEKITSLDYRTFLHLLNPIAPHMSEELNEIYGLGDVLCESSWPTYEDDKLVERTKEIAVQVGGKVRATIEISIDEKEDSIKEKALACENVKRHLEGKEIIKVIVIQGKIVNIVVK